MPPGIYDSYELRVWLWDIKNLEPLAYRRYADLLLGRLCQELGFEWEGRPYSFVTPLAITSFMPLKGGGWLMMESSVQEREAVVEIFTAHSFSKGQASWWLMQYLDAGISEHENGE